ncbi:DUF2164 domain-containing protein [Metabacillus arenae]|uniref:DUF2164 domain-containing protein n=1 Tax=Metabacillus arenae TaxID=2771434 RepID=A0A926NKZ9_9BACI|nr:DUF2164 domain-containing protein [Metabacillus arenae]MBD1379746.1 DUF2164 domain-containing protein [Metabacillus arenae]
MEITLSKENKAMMIESIQTFFQTERDEEIGIIAAESILDFMMDELGTLFYNQGVHDAKTMVEQKIMNLDEDLDSLVRPLKR